jgi:hypothetical protein
MLFFYAAGIGLTLAAARLLLGRPAIGPAGAEAAITSGQSLRWWPAAVVALLIQVLLTWWAAGSLVGPWRVAALWATHAVLASVILANLRRPGMGWLLAGMALNFLVMAANGGLMPVSPETLARGGREHVLARAGDGGAYAQAQPKKNLILREDETRLALLSDRLVVPGHPGAFSAGDVLIAAGIVVALGAAGGGIRGSITSSSCAI